MADTLDDGPDYDQPEAVPARLGEELDAAVVADYLRLRLPRTDGDLEIVQFIGGRANLTYLLRFGAQEYVLRRPPPPPVAPGAHDMAREYRVLSALHPLFPLAPHAYLFCEDESVMGVPFFVMERRQGLVIRRDMPPQYVHDLALQRRMATALVEALADLHQVDVQAAGLERLGRPDGFMARQIAGWTRRWERAKPFESPIMEEVTAWINSHVPPSPPATLVHNDYKLDNTMLDADDPGRLIAIFDWDMCTLGDPLADLGQLLCYWPEAGDPAARIEAFPSPTLLPGFLTRAEVVQRYAERNGADVSHIAFYEAYGLWRTATVVAQLFMLYQQGQSKDERLSTYDRRMQAFAEAAQDVIQHAPL
jgi:aminoglycoside phosphotransferase (APT) family kinase protein